jgi:hypothetical protein
MLTGAYRRRADARRRQLEPLVQELAAATAPLPNKQAWQAISARLAAEPAFGASRYLRRRAACAQVVWDARARLRREQGTAAADGTCSSPQDCAMVGE